MSNALTFKQRLLGLQSNLTNFAFRLTANKESAMDLVQATPHKVLHNES